MLLLGSADGFAASSGRRLPRQLQHAPAAARVSPPTAWMQTSDSDSDSESESESDSDSDSQPLHKSELASPAKIPMFAVSVPCPSCTILPHCFTISLSLHTAVKHVVRFEHATKSGMEDCSTTVRSQDEFSTLFISGAQMWTVNVTTSKRIDAIVTLEQALAVQDAADPEVVLRYYPGRLDPSRLDNLESYRDNRATGLEQQSCTRGGARSGFQCDRLLTVINDGRSVKFQSKTTDGEPDDIIQVDGLLLSHEAVVMNEVSMSKLSLAEASPRGSTSRHNAPRRGHRTNVRAGRHRHRSSVREKRDCQLVGHG